MASSSSSKSYAAVTKQTIPMDFENFGLTSEVVEKNLQILLGEHSIGEQEDAIKFLVCEAVEHLMSFFEHDDDDTEEVDNAFIRSKLRAFDIIFNEYQQKDDLTMIENSFKSLLVKTLSRRIGQLFISVPYKTANHKLFAFLTSSNYNFLKKLEKFDLGIKVNPRLYYINPSSCFSMNQVPPEAVGSVTGEIERVFEGIKCIINNEYIRADDAVTTSYNQEEKKLYVLFNSYCKNNFIIQMMFDYLSNYFFIYNVDGSNFNISYIV